jgi:hypothetical protein
MEAIRSSETSVYILSTRRHIPEDGVLYVNVVLKAEEQKEPLDVCKNITLNIWGKKDYRH